MENSKIHKNGQRKSLLYYCCVNYQLNKWNTSECVCTEIYLLNLATLSNKHPHIYPSIHPPSNKKTIETKQIKTVEKGVKQFNLRSNKPSAPSSSNIWCYQKNNNLLHLLKNSQRSSQPVKQPTYQHSRIGRTLNNWLWVTEWVVSLFNISKHCKDRDIQRKFTDNVWQLQLIDWSVILTSSHPQAILQPSVCTCDSRKKIVTIFGFVFPFGHFIVGFLHLLENL